MILTKRELGAAGAPHTDNTDQARTAYTEDHSSASDNHGTSLTTSAARAPSVKRGRRYKVNKRRISIFLNSLEQAYSVTKAAQAAGLSAPTLYDLRRNDKDFAIAWAAAQDRAIDRVEAAAYERAVDGIAEPIYQRGELVGTRQVYSDRLAELLLKAHRPRYRQAASEAATNVSVTIHRFGDQDAVSVGATIDADPDAPYDNE